jgi:hypothetical protein
MRGERSFIHVHTRLVHVSYVTRIPSNNIHSINKIPEILSRGDTILNDHYVV